MAGITPPVPAASTTSGGYDTRRLRWAPPSQTSPTIVTAGTITHNFYSATFGDTEDVILQLPTDAPRTSSMVITGGRHIRVIGGQIVNQVSGAAMAFQGCTGSVFVEGVDIDMTAVNNDALDVSGRQLTDTKGPTYPDVYIQNCRFYNVNGTLATTHADMFQAQGPIGRVFVDKFTGTSNYQGFFLPPQNPIAQVWMSRVNLSYTDPSSANFTYLLWWLDSSAQHSPLETPYPVILQDVYVQPRNGQTLATNAVWPQSGQTSDGIAAITLADGTVTWPSKTMRVSGVVTSGAPSCGNYVAAGVAGLTYAPPGYQQEADTTGFPYSPAPAYAPPLLPWDTASIVTTFDWRNSSAAGTFTANQARGGRVKIPKDGVLHDLAIQIGTASGNISAAIYDVGATTSGTRTRLWTSGAIACPTAGASGALTIIGDPALAVKQGQYLEFWLSVDNATAAFVRATPAAVSLPSSYTAPAGGLTAPSNFAPVQGTAHPCPTTLPGTLTAGGALPLITCRLT